MRKGVVLGRTTGAVIGVINTEENAGTIFVSFNENMANGFNAELSFSKKNLKKAERFNVEDCDLIYHYNYNTNKLEY